MSALGVTLVAPWANEGMATAVTRKNSPPNFAAGLVLNFVVVFITEALDTGGD
jgi:hypothetical protein